MKGRPGTNPYPPPLYFFIKIEVVLRTFYQIKGAEDGGSFSFFLLLFIIKNFEIIIKIKIINLKFASELQRS